MKKAELNRLIKLLDAGTAKRTNYYNAKLLKEYKLSLDYVRSEIKKLLVKFKNDPVTYAEASQRLRNIEPQIIERINKLTKKSISTIQAGTTDIFEKTFTKFNSIINEALDTKAPKFGLLSDKSINASVINPYDWKGAQAKYSNKLLQTVKSSVTQGLISGKSYPKILKDVTNRFNVGASNATRILRTELHKAESVAKVDTINNAQEIGERLGYKVSKIWSTFKDDRTRTSHEDLDGTVADDNGLFNVGGIQCEGPGLTGDPAEDINCRCTITIDIKDTNS